VFVALHANHPRELTGDARAACARLIDLGLPMLSQTVLLRDVNDDVETLKALMRAFSLRQRLTLSRSISPHRFAACWAVKLSSARRQIFVRRLARSNSSVPLEQIDGPQSKISH
jgi:hypothetical protein